VYKLKIKILVIKKMEEKKIIKISIIAVIIYFIGEKTYYLVSEIFLWLSTFLQNQNDYVFAFFQIFAILLGLFVLVRIFNYVFKRDSFDNKTIFILLMISIVLSGVMVLLNYELVLFDIRDKQVYLGNFALSKSVEFLFPIISLLYFYRKLDK